MESLVLLQKKHERSRYVNLENIPKYLKENASWCLWKYETRNNKETKIPFNSTTDGYISVNDPKTFTSFDKASEKLSSYDGLGIRGDGKLVAIDVDDCVINGVLNDLAKEIVNHFPQSYIEFSPRWCGFK